MRVRRVIQLHSSMKDDIGEYYVELGARTFTVVGSEIWSMPGTSYSLEYPITDSERREVLALVAQHKLGLIIE